MPRTVELDLDVIAFTDKALYLTDGTYNDWTARSLMEDDPGEVTAEDTVTIEIPEWVARDAGWV